MGGSVKKIPILVLGAMWTFVSVFSTDALAASRKNAAAGGSGKPKSKSIQINLLEKDVSYYRTLPNDKKCEQLKAELVSASHSEKEKFIAQKAPVLLRTILNALSLDGQKEKAAGVLIKLLGVTPQLLEVMPEGSRVPFYLHKIPNFSLNGQWLSDYIKSCLLRFGNAPEQLLLFEQSKKIHDLLDDKKNIDRFLVKIDDTNQLNVSLPKAVKQNLVAYVSTPSGYTYRQLFETHLVDLFLEVLAQHAKDFLSSKSSIHKPRLAAAAMQTPAGTEELKKILEKIPAVWDKAVLRDLDFGDFRHAFLDGSDMETTMGTIMSILSIPNANNSLKKAALKRIETISGRREFRKFKDFSEDFASTDFNFTDALAIQYAADAPEPVVSIDFVDWLYKSPLFTKFPENSALKAVAIVWNAGVGSVFFCKSHSYSPAAIWNPDLLNYLLERDDALHTDDRFVCCGVTPQSKALRVAALLTQLSKEKQMPLKEAGNGRGSLLDGYIHMKRQALKILSGNGGYDVAERLATKDEFLLILNLLEDTTKDLEDSQLTEIMVPSSVSMLKPHQKEHRQNMVLCALAQKNKDTAVSREKQIELIFESIKFSSLRLEQEKIEKKLVALEKHFDAPGILLVAKEMTTTDMDE